jgi:hypothetical protein
MIREVGRQTSPHDCLTEFRHGTNGTRPQCLVKSGFIITTGTQFTKTRSYLSKPINIQRGISRGGAYPRAPGVVTCAHNNGHTKNNVTTNACPLAFSIAGSGLARILRFDLSGTLCAAVPIGNRGTLPVLEMAIFIPLVALVICFLFNADLEPLKWVALADLVAALSERSWPWRKGAKLSCFCPSLYECVTAGMKL